MPLGEIEQHPYLQQGYINSAKSLILGTFPVYWCTDNDTKLKQQFRDEKGAFRFFYGSYRSSFWNLYSTFIDKSLIIPYSSESILKSLAINSIGISDLILSCEREKYSASDNDLYNKSWNIIEIKKILEKENITKILCTSKYVLSNFTSRIVNNNNFGVINNEETVKFKNLFIADLGGDVDFATGSIAAVYSINGRRVEALAIPSPGSPFRQLSTFGFVKGDNKIYANEYFENAFCWLSNQ